MSNHGFLQRLTVSSAESELYVKYLCLEAALKYLQVMPQSVPSTVLQVPESCIT